MMKTRVVGVLLGSLLFFLAGMAVAQRPAQNINAGRHPHLAKAQQFGTQAFNQIVQAQQANEWDMQGHAQKAKELLDQANNELRQAATAANKNK